MGSMTQPPKIYNPWECSICHDWGRGAAIGSGLYLLLSCLIPFFLSADYQKSVRPTYEVPEITNFGPVIELPSQWAIIRVQCIGWATNRWVREIFGILTKRKQQILRLHFFVRVLL